MQVNLLTGFAICNGCQKLQENDTTLNIPQASSVYDRIDTVVLRLNDNDDVRECEFYVISGEPAVSPVRPALTRTDSIWELGLADILVKANSTQVSNANITDTRYEAERCGIISSISQFDTTTLYLQIQTDLKEFKEVNQAEFVTWFDSIKNQLEGDVAANLQKQIGALANLKTANKSDLVSAINELAEKKIDVLDTMEEVEANTDSGKVAGALALKEVASNLGGLTFYEDDEGNKYVVGADSVPKKLGDIEFYEQRVTTYGGDVWQEYTLENPPKNGIIVFFPYASRMAFYSKDTNFTTDLGANGIDYTFGDATIKLFLSVGLSSYSVVNSVITF